MKAEYEEKFIVINKKHFIGVPRHIQDEFSEVMGKLESYFPPGNKYYICNQDEPYAEKVIDIILEGEFEKKGKDEVFK